MDLRYRKSGLVVNALKVTKTSVGLVDLEVAEGQWNMFGYFNGAISRLDRKYPYCRFRVF